MARLTARVLGAGAGGGVPQWNCGCDVCRLAWAGDARIAPRTQTGLAVSGDGERWTLLNASPDLRTQILATPPLHSRQDKRGSPIAAVVLTGGEVDQVAGLLSLRERHRFDLYATPETLALLDASRVFDVLDRALVQRRAVAPGERISLPGGLEAELVPVAGKPPLYMENDSAGLESADGAVAIEVAAGGKRLVFAPGVAALTPALEAALARADVVLFDATLFTDDEMIRSGTGSKTGRRMGHMPVAGPDGSLAQLRNVPARRIYIHLNNTNPMLVAGSPERRAVEAAGWEIAEDGMEIAP